MTFKFKDLKEQPLLSPPGVSGAWARVTDEDIDVILDLVRTDRKSEAGGSLARVHYWLRELGHPQEITKEDRGAIDNWFGMYRGGGMDIALAWMSHSMRKLGMMRDLPDDVVTKTIGHLETTRRFADGRELIQMHHYLKCIDLQQGITAVNRKKMIGSLGKRRDKEDGWGLAEGHHFLRELGMAQRITPTDWRMIKNSLETDRGKKDGFGIAKVLFHVSNLPLSRGASDVVGMPPIKKFAKS